ncbi:MAG TPA: 2,3-bisphosphoglycerate-independent phosphoglycerate mutase [Holosporales bacterium]|nr:2,3-bisphosphoglycerate-independent phosphoglycerate mutase [Holosporales bacterium]
MLKPVLLCILDGWGISPETNDNPISEAGIYFKELAKKYSSTTLNASGTAVGLPQGQMGNSEVGHATIGLGRIIKQDLIKISDLIQSGELFKNEDIKSCTDHLQTTHATCHVVGLLSPGGIHAHQDHIEEIIHYLINVKKVKVAFHALLDGRDTPPQSAQIYLQKLLNRFKDSHHFMLATLSGRYYGMDRDNRWERIERFYQAATDASAPTFENPLDYIQASYNDGIFDEFIIPACNINYTGMHDEDALWITNFRSDRVRQMLNALLLPDFNNFNRRRHLKFSHVLGMNAYSENLIQNSHLKSLLIPNNSDQSLGQIISKNNLRQLRIAETEKYPHVTYFFNGGTETLAPLEEHKLIPSPKVATYDLQPEMSAKAVYEYVADAIENQTQDFIVLNFANADMVGHTGKKEAILKAISTLDTYIHQLAEKCIKNDWIMLISADHGNAEQLIDQKNNQPHTAHTNNKVPFIMIDKQVYTLRNNGALCDIAPTILTLMNICQPDEMTGKSLII